MPNVFELQVSLTGWDGGPGMNTWHFTGGLFEPGNIFNDITSGMQSAYTVWKPYLAHQVAYRGTGVIKEFDPATGDLVALHQYDPDDINGISTATTNDSNVPRTAMVKLRLVTDQIRGQRVLQGGPFIGPISEQVIDDTGKVKAAQQLSVPEALSGLMSGAGPRLAVWGRPTPSKVGVVGDVVSATVMPKIAVLTSRRD